jgi:hypothetical protein
MVLPKLVTVCIVRVKSEDIGLAVRCIYLCIASKVASHRNPVSIPEMGNILPFAKATIPATETTQPPIQWVLRSLCLKEGGRRVKLTTPI